MHFTIITIKNTHKAFIKKTAYIIGEQKNNLTKTK